MSKDYKRPQTDPQEEVELNFQNVCRTCLSHENQLTNIFEVAFEGVNVSDIFDKYMKMQVTENDDLPQNVCYTCLYEVCHLYMFINNSKKVEEKLKIINTKRMVGDETVDNDVKDKEDSAPNLEENIQVDGQETDEDSDDLECKIKTKPANDEYDVKNSDEEVEYYVAEPDNYEPVEKEGDEEVEDDAEECEDGTDQKEGTVDLLKLGPIRIREIGPPFTCYCGDEYGTLEELKEHRSMRKHSKNIKRYLCRICSPSKLYSYKTWFAHMQNHKEDNLYQCELCGVMSKSAHNHYRHLRSHNGEKPYICEICGKRFSRSTGLKQHRLNHDTENDKNHRKTRVTHNCDKCDKSFFGVLAYNKHMYDVHAISPHTCHICGKSFAHKASLNIHILVHTGKKPFKCNLCERSFVQKTHLNTHYKIHTGEKPFTCPYCLKKFALNGNLTVHKRIHTGEKPYICNICKKGFYDSSSMKTHRKRHY